MNEVRGNQSVGYPTAVAASSKGGDTARTKVTTAESSTSTVASEVASRQLEKSADVVEKVSQAIAQMNEFIQSEQRDLRFSIDEGSGHTVVRVVDRESGELIRQIPNEIFLRLAEEAQQNESLHLINVHG